MVCNKICVVLCLFFIIVDVVVCNVGLVLFDIVLVW